MPTLPEDPRQSRPDRSPGAFAAGGVERETLTEKVETAMRVDILRGVFLPGSRIRGSEARVRYGVSPTPFREALQRLASDGLVEIDPQSGARVARVSHEDLEDVFALRRLLEREALCRTIRNATADSGWAADLSLAIDRYRERVSALLVRRILPVACDSFAATRRSASKNARKIAGILRQILLDGVELRNEPGVIFLTFTA